MQATAKSDLEALESHLNLTVPRIYRDYVEGEK